MLVTRPELCENDVTVEYLAELIELYEYKVADVVAGRNPRGGRHALNDLRRELLTLDLEPLLMRRLVQSDRQYREWRKQTQEQNPAVQTAPASAFAWTRGVDQPDEASQMGWQLETLAWHAEMAEQLGQQNRDLRHEPLRPTLRVLYAVTENAERTQRGVSARFAVPQADDPLVSLGSKEVVDDITLSLTNLLLTPEGRQLVMTTLAEVRENPFPMLPAEEDLREQLAAAERENLTPKAREELIAALRAQHPKAPDPRERPAIREASVRLQRQLEEYLRILPDEQKHRKVLFAPSVPMLLTPDEHASELLIYLAGEEQETRWHGLTIRWQSAGPNWQVQVGKQVLMLYPHLSAAERRADLGQFALYYQGPYLLLQLRGDFASELGALAAQARAVALLLSPSEDYANLRLARAAAQHLRGAPLNLSALTPASAEKFAQAAPDDLQDFVRQGLSTLISRIEPLTPEEVRAALQYCAETLQMSLSRVDRLHEALHNILHNPDQISALAFPALPGGARLLRAGGHFQSFQMEGDPLTIGIKDRAVTLRWDYKNDLSVVIAGLPSLILTDLLVVPLSDMDLMFVRQGKQVALASMVHQPSSEDTDIELD